MARNLIDGQKAGSGSPRQPVIAPDSASSITKLKIVVGLSEGEIEGFGRADIKLDGTPLTVLSNDIICDYRFGTNDQRLTAYCVLLFIMPQFCRKFRRRTRRCIVLHA